jgi:hypothetical protein
MLGSTILDQIVTPALFYAFGSRVVGPDRSPEDDAELGRPASQISLVGEERS